MSEALPITLRPNLRVQYARALVGWHQRHLATELGISRAQLSNIELGRTRLTFRDGWRICKLLNISPEWLANGHPPEAPFCSLNPRLLKAFDMVAANGGRDPFADVWVALNQFFKSLNP
jgi:transcriptional regulator with XRE-family HTH domain